MQFTKENAAKVMAGTKTQTRRIVKEGEYFFTFGNVKTVMQPRLFWNSQYATGVVKWEEGRTYAVCPGRGKPAIGRIRLLSIRKEKLQDISEADALAELGYGLSYNPSDELPIRDFAYLWDSINPKGKRWANNPDVWALTFEVVK